MIFFVKIQILGTSGFGGCTVSVATSNSAVEDLGLIKSQFLEMVTIPVSFANGDISIFLPDFVRDPERTKSRTSQSLQNR